MTDSLLILLTVVLSLLFVVAFRRSFMEDAYQGHPFRHWSHAAALFLFCTVLSLVLFLGYRWGTRQHHDPMVEILKEIGRE